MIWPTAIRITRELGGERGGGRGKGEGWWKWARIAGGKARHATHDEGGESEGRYGDGGVSLSPQAGDRVRGIAPARKHPSGQGLCAARASLHPAFPSRQR